MIDKVKEVLLEKIIDLFLEIEAFQKVSFEDIHPRRLRSLRKFIRKLNRLLTFMDFFITDKLGSDKRFLRIPINGNEDKFLIKPFKLLDFACPPYPFVRMNKRFLEALSWLNDLVEEEGYKLNIVRGFVPYLRSGRFSWEFRLVTQHEKGKAVDVIISGLNPSQTLSILQKVYESQEEKPFPLGFWEINDGVHVGFLPNPVTKRFFPKGCCRLYPCTSNPNLPFPLE